MERSISPRIVGALRNHLRKKPHDAEVTQETGGAYDDERTLDQLESLIGKKEAANFRALKAQLAENFTKEVTKAEEEAEMEDEDS